MGEYVTPTVQKERSTIATHILAALLHREGEPQDLSPTKRLGLAIRAVEWADALIDALNK